MEMEGEQEGFREVVRKVLELIQLLPRAAAFVARCSLLARLFLFIYVVWLVENRS